MNSDRFPSLDLIDIATPCEMSWDDMQGDDRARLCSACRLNVYNLSELSRAEAERLVFEREGRTCVRFFRRSDGTLLTNDCPVGLRLLRRRLARSIAAVAALVGFLTCGIAFGRFQSTRPGPALVDGPLSRLIEWIDPSAITGSIIIGEICAPPPPAPTQTPAPAGK